MRTLITTLLLLAIHSVFAQLTSPQQKLILFNGDVINGERLIYDSPVMRAASFIVDDEPFETSSVEFFQNKHGYFANLARLHNSKQERYAMRIHKGKLNLFEEIEMEVYGGDELQVEGHSNGRDPMLASGEVFHYYNKGDETIKKATYSNLKIDLSDNPESMKHLKSYKKYQMLQWGLIGVGVGLIAANVLAQADNGVKFNPVMAIGFVVGGSSYFLQAPKEDFIWLAADEYNKPEAAVVSNP